jgi:hypothetical protein
LPCAKVRAERGAVHEVLGHSHPVRSCGAYVSQKSVIKSVEQSSRTAPLAIPSLEDLHRLCARAPAAKMRSDQRQSRRLFIFIRQNPARGQPQRRAFARPTASETSTAGEQDLRGCISTVTAMHEQVNEAVDSVPKRKHVSKRPVSSHDTYLSESHCPSPFCSPYLP